VDAKNERERGAKMRARKIRGVPRGGKKFRRESALLISGLASQSK
jgi:hypothetical protein